MAEEAKAINFAQMRPRRKRERENKETADKSVVDPEYLEMLNRIYALLQASRPSSKSSQGQIVAIAPQVARSGTKKTAFKNFMDVSIHLNRKPQHLQDFFYKELNT